MVALSEPEPEMLIQGIDQGPKNVLDGFLGLHFPEMRHPRAPCNLASKYTFLAVQV